MTRRKARVIIIMKDEKPQCWERGRHRKVDFRKVPIGAWLLSKVGLFNFYPEYSYKLYTLALTYCCYAAFHMSRKPFSVVIHVFAPNCSFLPQRTNSSNVSSIYDDIDDDDYINHSMHRYTRAVNPEDYIDGWPPFNTGRCNTLIGAMGYSLLFSYAVFLFISGLIADRVNIRYFITIGMIGSGVSVGLLGVAYYGEIHEIAYFIVVQIFIGIFQSTGWPSLLSIMGNWQGISKRGLVLGVWSSHTFVGNILGTAIPAIWAVRGENWSWAFLVPGFVMIFMAFIIFFFLILDPSHVGLPPPKHHKDSDTTSSKTESPVSSKKDSPTTSFNDMKRHGSLTTAPLVPSEEFIMLEKKSHDNKNESEEESKNIENGGNDTVTENGKSDQPTSHKTKKKAIGVIGVLKIPGVIEYALAYFFTKLVVYTFLFWLPYYITFHEIGGQYLGEKRSNLLATLYDVGGIIGGIITGGLSDLIGARAITSITMIYLSVPTLFLYRYVGPESLALTIFFIIMCGFFTNGPYILIAGAVAADLGTHKTLKENQRAKATVGAIIDGMGSLGAACGPLITGWVSDDFGWNSVFYVLMFSCFMSSLMLSRLLVTEIRRFYSKIKIKCRQRRK